MKKESLYIENFGPITHADLSDLRKINVLIGVSGSGKSTVMKVLAMCRWIYKMQCIRTYLKTSGVSSTPFRLRTDRILSANGLVSLLRPESVMEYVNGSYKISLRNGKFTFPGPKEVPAEELSLEKVAYISDKRVMLPDLVNGNVSLKHGMFYLEETLGNFQKSLDFVTETALPYLGVCMDVRKTAVGRRIYVSSESEENMFRDLPLSRASSGMQSSVGLHFILAYFSRYYDPVQAMNSTIVGYLADTDSLGAFKPQTNIGAFPYKRIDLHVEEPELSLFPTNQKGLVEYMVNTIYASQSADITLTFATHSPYILTSLNVLTLAGKAMEKDAAAAKEAIGATTALPSGALAAWELKEGQSRSLTDPETGLIDGSWLDSASDTFDETIYRLNSIIYG